MLLMVGTLAADEVIGGLIEGIDLIAGGGHNGLDLIGIGDGVDLDGKALASKAVLASSAWMAEFSSPELMTMPTVFTSGQRVFISWT